MDVERLLWVTLGSAIGGPLPPRSSPRAAGILLSYGTLAVNLIGSFLIGLIMRLNLSSTPLPAACS
jgi:fluoride ion exporter CrcB/FEX